MGQHTKIEALDILLDKVTQIENKLLLSDDLHSWLKKQSDTDKAVYSERLFKISIDRSRLQNQLYDIILEEFGKIEKQLDDAAKELKREIEEMQDFSNAMETLGKVLGLIVKVVAVAVAPSAAPLAIVREIMKARSDSDLRRVKYSLRDTELFAMPAGSFVELETPPKSSIEEKAPLFLIEEVLYGVELTKEKLIITVVSGGCTKEGDFRFDVNKGSEGQQQYTVTVYRIKPDDYKRVPELIQISYSREELGLDGHAVEFILRNKIGNTSQHRLNS